MGLFEDAGVWQKRKDRGETQAAIAESVHRSQAAVSRTLKCGRLPGEERQQYEAMLAARQITEGAVMDLATYKHAAFRRSILQLAIHHRRVRDGRDANQPGRRGLKSEPGKVTVDDVKSAVEELRAEMQVRRRA